MTADHGTWSLGVLIGLPILLLVIALLGAVLVLLGHVKEAAREEGEMGVWWTFVGGTWMVIAIVVILAASPAGYYPYSGEYHQWREASGTVQQIDKRLISTGDSMEDKFVVRFAGTNQQFGCDDTRCASVHEGDTLTLSCKRAWQYTGTDGYDCRFVSTEAAS